MAGELALSKKTTGLTLYGVILGTNRNQRWNGSAFVDTSSITDANWATGLVSFTEDATSDATATVTYTADWPAITAAGSYMVEVRAGNTPGATLEGVILYTLGDAAADIADAVWDELLTGASHNLAKSAGRRLREAASATILSSGTAQAAGNNTITLEAGESAVDDWYNDCLIVIESGTGAGQAHAVSDYDGTTKVATMAHDWHVNPDATSVYIIYAFAEVSVHKIMTDALATFVNTDTGEVTAAAGSVAQLAQGTGGSTVNVEIEDRSIEVRT
jgi:hypothetical protein